MLVECESPLLTANRQWLNAHRFLWASLQIQNLSDPERMLVVRDVEDALLQLPPTLTQLYILIMERIDKIAPHGRALAKKALRWLLCAREPLGDETLIQMLALSNTDRQQATQLLRAEILSLCCNLVIFDETLTVFRFAHASVREFLETQPGFGSQEINAEAAQECLDLLLSKWEDRPGVFAPDSNGKFFKFDVVAAEDSNTPQGPAPTRNFAHYAIKYWIFHYSDLEIGFRMRHSLKPMVVSFFVQGSQSPKSRYNVWQHNLSYLQLSIHLHPFLEACTYGLLEVVEELTVCSPAVDLNMKTPFGATGLYLAASRGFQDIVGRLLELGADSGGISTNSRETALHGAAKNGHEATVLLLLQNGADVKVKDDQGWTALDEAAKGEHEAVVRLLIERGSDGEALQKYGQRLVIWARRMLKTPECSDAKARQKYSKFKS